MSSTSSITSEQALSRLREVIVELGPEADDVTMDATFEQLELDSLDLVELREVLSEDFDVQVERAVLAELRTVGDIVNLIVAGTR